MPRAKGSWQRRCSSRDEVAKKLAAWQARDAIDYQAFISTVQQADIGLRVVLAEGPQRSDVLGVDGLRALHLDSEERAFSIDDEVDFHTRLRSPEGQAAFLAAVGDPRPQVLRNQPLQACPADLLRAIQRPLGSNRSEDAGIRVVELGVLDEVPAGALREGSHTEPQQQVLEDLNVSLHFRFFFLSGILPSILDCYPSISWQGASIPAIPNPKSQIRNGSRAKPAMWGNRARFS